MSMRDPSILCITLGKSLHFLVPLSSCKGDILHSQRFLLFHFLCFVIVYWQIIVESKVLELLICQSIRRYFHLYRSDEMDTPAGKTMILEDKLAINSRSLENMVSLTQ